MEVILVKELASLGYPGAVVKVKNGFARNYLIPQRIAVKKTRESLKVLEKQKEEFAKIAEEKESQYQVILSRIESLKDFEIKANVGENGKLFGTVTNRDLAEALKFVGIEIDKKQIILKNQIKAVGQYVSYIQLNKNHKAELNFLVVSK